ncbi:MAG: DUF1223 domain-containing protein [Betaproteobacteria bacterium]
MAMTSTARNALLVVLAVSHLGATAGVAATACEATSGAKLLPLVELFTSEGCDSCPPADRWLASGFPVATSTPQASVLAFHVDYWDRLGWKDRFATPQFTARQYAALRSSGETFVYTPQVLVQGKDARNWGGGAVTEKVAASRVRPARADIKVALDGAAGGVLNARLDVRVPETPLQKRTEVWLAYTDSRLVSEVKAGENRGVRLTHDHVVRTLAGPFALDAQGHLDRIIAIARPAEAGSGATLVAVVQDAKNGDVLQTLSLPVCGE